MSTTPHASGQCSTGTLCKPLRPSPLSRSSQCRSAQRGELARRPLRYLSFLLSLHQKAALGEMLSSLQASVVQRTASSDLSWIPHQVFVFPPEAMHLDAHHKQE